jgi:hypothetical protein
MTARTVTARDTLRCLCLALALLSAAGCGSKASAPDGADAGSSKLASPSASPPESLSRAARQLLEARMKRHGEQMSALMNAVVVLDWAGVQRASVRLIEEPAFAPPLPGDEVSFNAQLPPSFFVRQRELLEAVRALNVAAEQKSDHALKVAFNSVSGACIQCHATYLEQAARPDVFDARPACKGPGCASE